MLLMKKTVLQLEEELFCQRPGKDPVTKLSPEVATARLNSIFWFQGLSWRNIWTLCNQFTNERIPVSDPQHIVAKHQARQTNHQCGEKVN